MIIQNTSDIAKMYNHAPLDLSISAAQEASRSGEVEKALSIWESIRLAYPEQSIGYSEAAALLTQIGRADEAAALITQAADIFPNDEKILVEYAWLAHHRSEWTEAERRWASIRQKYPSCFSGYFGGGVVLRVLKRFDEAEAVYREALKTWPNASNLLADFATLAHARGDNSEASRRWAALRNAFPDDPKNYLREAVLLRENRLHDAAAEIIGDALRRFPNQPEVLTECARLAQHRGDISLALKKWEVVIENFPDLSDGYVGAGHALNGLGRFADARFLLQPATRRFPHSPELSIIYAWTHHYLKDFSEASILWSKIRNEFPAQVVGYSGGATTLIAMGRLSEADELLTLATRKFSGDFYAAMDWARAPQHSQKWQEAIDRWSEVYRRFPLNLRVQLGYAQSLAKGGDWEAAEKLLATIVSENDDEPLVWISYANCATQRRDWEESEDRWQQAIARFPDLPDCWSGFGEMLIQAGRFTESERFLELGLTKLPGNLDLECKLAISATLRRDWPVALGRWADLKARHPEIPSVVDGITQALWQARQDLGVAEKLENRPSFEIPPILLKKAERGDTRQADLYNLFMQFESIGDTCEFGIVQRRFGAEPISLLRWTSTDPNHLIAALDSDFSGVGDAEHTVIDISHGEYVTRDRRYHMFSHTFTPATAETPERFSAQHLRRTQYLRRKLIDDLATGEKIFVYKSIRGLTDSQALGIHNSIRRYNAHATLLCVRIADENHPCTTVEVLNEGLLMGYIDRFSTVDINFEAWVKICETVTSVASNSPSEKT